VISSVSCSCLAYPQFDVPLFLNQRAIKNGPGIKACLIGPPEALSVLIFFLKWQDRFVYRHRLIAAQDTLQPGISGVLAGY
jgi:hypothetical protein